jgi:hypothetical protein
MAQIREGRAVLMTVDEELGTIGPHHAAEEKAEALLRVLEYFKAANKKVPMYVCVHIAHVSTYFARKWMRQHGVYFSKGWFVDRYYRGDYSERLHKIFEVD